MNVLIITQKVDTNDDIMGFFNGWVTKIADCTNKTYVIANYVGEVDVPENVIIYSLGKEKGRSRIMRHLYFYRYFFKVITDIDGIFAHMCPEYVLATYPIATIYRKKIVLWYSHAKVSKLAGWASRHVHKIVTSSSAGFVFKTENLLETGHGIDTDIFSPSDKKNENLELKLFAISRISHIKDYDTLIDAMSILVHGKQMTDIKLEIAGTPTRKEDHEYFESIKKKIAKLKLESYITWLGSVSNRDTVNFYQNTDIFVRMQEAGGFGKTELEAMAVGTRAIVPTDVYKDLLGDFAKELYFEAKNPESLADTIYSVSKWSDNKLENYSKVARDVVLNNHNLETLAKKIVNSFN